MPAHRLTGPDLLDSPATMRAWSERRRAAGGRVVLVPTMGALHDGHVALIDAAREIGDHVVVSIFVNPLQFNRRDDFDLYPRPLDDDIATCAAAQVDAVYAPTAAAMYPPLFQTHVEPGALAEPFEGAGRPGHFRGVTTVVCKLFGATLPHVAVFGQKDFQQLAVVRRMTNDLDMHVEIHAVPTVREADGLALSSRNRRLTPEDRAAAVCLPRALAAIAEAARAGRRDTTSLVAAGTAVIAAEPRARLEYLAVADSATLRPLDALPAGEDAGAVALGAVWFGDVRLIDNTLL